MNLKLSILFSEAMLPSRSKRHRSYEMIERFIEFVKHEAEDKSHPPVLLRKKDFLRRLNDGGDGHYFSSVHELYRKEYFKVINSLVGDIKKFFKMKNFIFVQKLDTLLLHSANGRQVTPSEDIIDMYERDINIQKLKLNLLLLLDAINSMHLDGIPTR